MRTASRAREIVPSQIRRVTDKARPTSLHLGLGQPDTELHPKVTQAIERYVHEGRAPYTPNLGTQASREAVARHLGIDPDEVIITHGVQQGLALAFLSLIEPGDEVLIPNPGFPAYANLVRIAGGVPVEYDLTPGTWQLDPDAVRAVSTERTRALLLNTPSNPTGAIHRAQELAAVLSWCAQRGITWISDEIYEDFVFDGAHVSPAATHAELGLRIGGLSKSHAMMGWRIGWVTGPRSAIAELKGLHQHLVTSACGASQAGLIAALDVHREQVDEMRRVFRARGALLSNALNDSGVVCPPVQGAFYHFVDVRFAMEKFGTSVALADAMLDQIDVVTIPGSGFGTGGEGYLRLAYTVDERLLADAASRIAEFFESM